MTAKQKEIVIALALDSDGNWGACGYSTVDGLPATTDAMQTALDCCDEMAETDARYWLRLFLEVPTARVAELGRDDVTIEKAE